MHLVVFPAAFVVASVLEDILSLPMLQTLLFLSDILVSVSIFLVDVFQLFVFRFGHLDRRGKQAV
jgi:hypothetical protein